MGPLGTPDDVIVFAGGDPVDAYRPWLLAQLPPSAWCVAADSGLHQADTLDLAVDLLVGDLDSVSPDRLERAIAEGIPIERHPVAKDHTDLELALSHARSRTTASLYVVGGGGGRLDHLLANVAVLCHPDLHGRSVTAFLPPASVQVVTAHTSLTGRPGETISLLAMNGPARGVTTEGLTFPLHNATIKAGSALGVSNTFAAHSASVNISDGVLLAIQPCAAAPAA